VRLEKAMTRDKVGHALESRHTHEELVHKGVVPPRTQGSRIAGVARKLQHNLTADKVGHLLEKRTDIDTLEKRGIAKDIHLASSLHQSARVLQRNLVRSNLYHALQQRPPLSVLRERNIYIASDEYDDFADAGASYEAEVREYKAAPAAAAPSAHEPSGYQRRSKHFHLTRILLKTVASMAEAGEISLQAKGQLKDLIVDQDKSILSVAELFDSDNDMHEFKESLIVLAGGRA